MRVRNNATVPPATNATPTVRQDIGTVLCRLVDALADVQTGLTAFMNVAADNDSEFARTAHYVVGKVDADLGEALTIASAAQDAFRVANQAGFLSEAAAAGEAAV